jgi:hypothetical protein
MRYVLLIHWDEKAAAASGFANDATEMAEHGRYIQALQESGKMLDGARLQVESKAVSVRVRDGKRVLTDGPFAEAKEALGGFYILECDSMDEAVEWAARCPSAKHGTIEVRPEWTA